METQEGCKVQLTSQLKDGRAGPQTELYLELPALGLQLQYTNRPEKLLNLLHTPLEPFNKPSVGLRLGEG